MTSASICWLNLSHAKTDVGGISGSSHSLHFHTQPSSQLFCSHKSLFTYFYFYLFIHLILICSFEKNFFFNFLLSLNYFPLFVFVCTFLFCHLVFLIYLTSLILILKCFIYCFAAGFSAILLHLYSLLFLILCFIL